PRPRYSGSPSSESTRLGAGAGWAPGRGVGRGTTALAAGPARTAAVPIAPPDAAVTTGGAMTTAGTEAGPAAPAVDAGRTGPTSAGRAGAGLGAGGGGGGAPAA